MKFDFSNQIYQSFPIYGLVLVVAFLYSSIGFGGASGYLAVMAWYEVPVNLAVSTALSLNLIVAGIAFVNYYKSGHFKSALLWPFVISSIPAAFFGATIQLSQDVYLYLLHTILFIISLRMLTAQDNLAESDNISPPSISTMLIVGAGLGFLAGMVGIGGGIFLSPLIILAKWGSPKNASATAAGFIFLNSLSGLIGRVYSGSFYIDSFGYSLAPLGIIGSLLGSRLGARHFSGKVLKRILGAILVIAVGRFFLDQVI